MDKQEYPKGLYGPQGWKNLDDYRIVWNVDEEEAARKDGYTDLGAPEDYENGGTDELVAKPKAKRKAKASDPAANTATGGNEGQ